MRSNIPLHLKEFPNAKPKGTPEDCQVLIRTVYHFYSRKGNTSLIVLIDNKLIYSLGSVL